jgi:uncharacterized protein (TIGR00369 family)
VGEPFDPGLYEQYCFACGRRNPLGLHVEFERADGGVRAHYTPRAEDVGFPGVIHGGVLVTLLDEAMAWAMYAEAYALGVTAKMDVRYRRAATPDDTLVLSGRVARVRGRRIEVDATIDAATGERLAEASALFLRVAPEREAELMRAIGWEVRRE